MTRTIIIAGALIASTVAALAQTSVTTSNCRKGYLGGVTCTATSTLLEAQPPRQLSKAELAEMDREKAERLAKWESFCKPEVYTDANYIKRYRYAHKGCDLGRDE
jgi:hypothetical protein